jgi:hypothetical protein
MNPSDVAIKEPKDLKEIQLSKLIEFSDQIIIKA